MTPSLGPGFACDILSCCSASASRLGRGMLGTGGVELGVGGLHTAAGRSLKDESRSQQHLVFGWPGESLIESTR